ncbi:hypothetical protein BDQ12DRAFT_605201 [Crucibulum laeve]|uniref:L-lysine 6-oxidase n=1 Tax=Crucibulum laeve TaxID=68775 RepID=A0A5C3MC79_9AGAR|nr:hypothetical protein BDQ12DRAFT_605201 [Crucibulum laeve]
MPVDFHDIDRLEIFPPIGIARVGDSGFDLSRGVSYGDIEWFLPSDIPGSDELPPGIQSSDQLRDSKKRIKRQAVRFRVYAFDRNGNVLGEVNNESGYELKWTVHVANAKGAFTEFRDPTQNRRNPDVQPESELTSVQPNVDHRTDLIVNPGPKSIGRTLVEPKPDPNPVPLTGIFYGSRKKSYASLSETQKKDLEVNLGELRTDQLGRLIFIAGAGYARCVSDPKIPNFQPDIISEFDSIDWVDDICDGWVDVVVQKTVDNTTTFTKKPKNKATVLSAPPKFAWGINAPTTLYDVIENLAHKNGISWRGGDPVEFYENIWPVLQSTYGLSWVNEQGFQGHGVAGKGNFLLFEKVLGTPDGEDSRILRDHIFERLRKPNEEDPSEASTKFMPRLSGDDGDALEPGENLSHESTTPPIRRFAALTELQYTRFKQWREGKFKSSQPFWKKQDGTPYANIEAAPLQFQPWLLTFAALEHTVGEPLYPGIEMYWLAKEASIYNLTKEPLAIPPFRINHTTVGPGHLSRGLSLPWQSDFAQCNTHWWPASRPDDVINILDWPQGQSITEANFIKDIAPKRRKWDRGIRETPDFPVDYFPGCTDMVRSWQKLGFISKQHGTIQAEGGEKLPVFLEQGRLKMEKNAPFTLPLSL